MKLYSAQDGQTTAMLNKFSLRSSFTLIELLIVIAILVILSSVVVLVLNPSELIAQTKDSQRMSDLANLNLDINFYLKSSAGRGAFSGTSSVIYVSLPDTASSTCGDLGLPALPSGYSYNCVSTTSLKNINGTGWIPIKLASTSGGAPIGNLPVDPVNSTSSGFYYTYASDGSGNFEMTAVMESIKYSPQEAKDGGPVNFMYEEGNKLTLSPFIRGIVGIWNFDGNGNDLSGQGNNFTASGVPLPSFVNGVTGDAYSFIGDSYLYASSTASTTPLGASPRTLGIWMYPLAVPPSDYIGMAYGTATSDQAFAIGAYSYSPSKGTTYAAPALLVDNDDLNSTTLLPLNQWSFLVGTWDGASLNIYLNGQSVGTRIPSGAINTTITIPLEVGGSPETVGYYMNGYLDEPFILNYALSASQIQNIYNAEKPQ